MTFPGGNEQSRNLENHFNFESPEAEQWWKSNIVYLKRYVYKLIGEKAVAEAEDILQEVYLRMLKSANFRGDLENLFPYVKKIITNLVLENKKYHRQKKRRILKVPLGNLVNLYNRQDTVSDALSNSIPEPPDLSQNLEAQVIGRNELEKLLSQLPPNHRKILLQELERLKSGAIQKEWAVTQGMKYDNYRLSVFRAKKYCKKKGITFKFDKK